MRSGLSYLLCWSSRHSGRFVAMFGLWSTSSISSALVVSNATGQSETGSTSQCQVNVCVRVLCGWSMVEFAFSRVSPRQPTPTTNSPKSDMIPTRVSSRRGRKPAALPLSPSNHNNHSSNSSSTDVQLASSLAPTNSPSMNLVLTRHQQQWTTAANNQR